MAEKKPEFRMGDGPAARGQRLEPAKALALAKALEAARRSARSAIGEDRLRDFLLPFAEFGLEASQMLALVEKLPSGIPDHKEMYYDFRLARWQRHVEPPTLEDCLEEYLASAPSREEGLDYLRGRWQAFLRKHGAS